MIINMNGAKAPETPSPVLQEKTVTPATLPTVIGADEGYTGLSQVTVNPDTNLKAENIRSGKTIFGVGGTFAGEPQPTGELDYTLIGYGGDGIYSQALANGYSTVMEENPTRLTELNLTQSTYYNNDSTNMTFIGYGEGLIAGKQEKFVELTSTYIPPVSSNKWYYKAGTIPAGEMKFYINISVYNKIGGMPNASHIKGEAYLLPVLFILTSDGRYYPLSISGVVSLRVASETELPKPIPITLDAELLDSDNHEAFFGKMFTLNVPETTFGSYGFISDSYDATKLYLTYVLIPSKVVIS